MASSFLERSAHTLFRWIQKTKHGFQLTWSRYTHTFLLRRIFLIKIFKCGSARSLLFTNTDIRSLAEPKFMAEEMAGHWSALLVPIHGSETCGSPWISMGRLTKKPYFFTHCRIVVSKYKDIAVTYLNCILSLKNNAVGRERKRERELAFRKPDSPWESNWWNVPYLPVNPTRYLGNVVNDWADNWI